MLAENKVQLEAIKTRNYMFGEKDGYVLCTEGRYIVYIKKEDFLLDIEKHKKIPEKGMEQFSPLCVKGEIRGAELSKRMVCSGTKLYRGIKDKETGEYAWFDVKYINMFKECNVGLRKNESNNTYDAVFMRYGEIVGYVLPIRSTGEWDQKGANMQLTREQAIKWHRRMWNEMAEKIEYVKLAINVEGFKRDFCVKHGFYLEFDCFLCEYTEDCFLCPVLWGKDQNDMCGRMHDDSEGLYTKVQLATTWQEQASLARQIANLPERTDV